MREARAETGPMQFGGDWCGLFIRGDNAMSYARELRAMVKSGRFDPAALEWFAEQFERVMRPGDPKMQWAKDWELCRSPRDRREPDSDGGA